MKLLVKNWFINVAKSIGLLKSNYIIRKATLTGTTNPNGVALLSWFTPSGVWDDRYCFPVNVVCTNIFDSITVIGFSQGPWVKVMNYQFSPYANTTVNILIYYVDIRGTTH